MSFWRCDMQVNILLPIRFLNLSRQTFNEISILARVRYALKLNHWSPFLDVNSFIELKLQEGLTSTHRFFFRLLKCPLKHLVDSWDCIRSVRTSKFTNRLIIRNPCNVTVDFPEDSYNHSLSTRTLYEDFLSDSFKTGSATRGKSNPLPHRYFHNTYKVLLPLP